MKPRITMDQLNSWLEEMAENPEAGPDRFRAIKMLKADGAVAAAPSDEMTSEEMVHLLSRLMLPAGEALCQVAFRRAFPNRGRPHHIEDTPELGVDELSPELKEQARNITSLKKLRKEFPGMNQTGWPKGYPMRRGIEVQLEWIRLKAERMFADRENSKIHPMEFKGLNEKAESDVRAGAPTPASGPEPIGSEETEAPRPLSLGSGDRAEAPGGTLP